MNEKEHKIKEVYEHLLNMLPLSDKHKTLLEKRGFTAEQITEMGYTTLPLSRKNHVDRLLKKFELDNVPGFWRNKKNIWQMSGKAGILIPVRRIDATIAALKIRADDRELAGKYLYFSTNPKPNKDGEVKYPNGTAAHPAVHHPNVKWNGGTLRITEGEIKADLATLLSDTYTISIPGIGMWQWAFEAVEALKPEKILLAFDSDKNKEFSPSTAPDAKPYAVAKALASLYLGLKEKGHDVGIEHWPDDKGKGIDDVLSAGFSDSIKIMDETEAQAFVVEAMRDDMPMNWIYVIGTKRFIELRTLQELDKEQFSDKHAPDFPKMKAAEKVLRHAGFPRVDFPTYEPGSNPIIERGTMRYLNLWKPCALQPEEGDVEPFLSHCQYMLPEEEEMNMLLDFLAFQVQKPGQKIHWAMLLQGIQGTGKSFFGSVMRKVLGENNVSTPSNEMIHEAFTGWQKSCQLIVIEELMARGRLELMNKLKPMITQPITIIREMYKPPYEQPNNFNLLIFTNHEDAIIIDRTDRRYCVLYSPAQPKPAEYYDKLWNWTDSHAGRILNFFQQRDLSAFNPHAHAPMTEAKKQLIEDSEPSLLSWIRDGIATEQYPFHSDLLTIADLMTKLPVYLYRTHPSSLGKALKQIGVKPLRQLRLSTGSYIRVMAARRWELWHEASDEKVIEEYEKWMGNREPGGQSAGTEIEDMPF